MIAASPDALPNDLDALRAVLLAERADKRLLIAERDAAVAERDQLSAANDKLHHIIAVLRRARFGRKSERLSEDQLALVLEEFETDSAKNEAREERREPEARAGEETPREPGRASRAFATDRADHRARKHALPLLRQGHACDRRREVRTPRQNPGSLSRDRHPPSQIRLRMRGGRGPGARAWAADRGRHSDRSAGRRCRRVEIRRPRPPARRSRPGWAPRRLNWSRFTSASLRS